MGDLKLSNLIAKVQSFTVAAMIVFLIVVVLLSTAHLGVLIWEEIWRPPRFIIPVQGLLDIFGYFLLVLIGVELLETLKVYVKKDTVHVRVVIEVALIAMARKVITEEPHAVPPAELFGIAALILALAIAFYFERQASGNNTETTFGGQGLVENRPETGEIGGATGARTDSEKAI
jgi:uncharacterized membrane protein (DUF373 family)